MPLHGLPVPGSLGQGVGYMNGFPIAIDACGGMCLLVYNEGDYLARVVIDGREVFVYAGGIPQLRLVSDPLTGSGKQMHPVPVIGARSRESLKIVITGVREFGMPAVGNHTVRVDFFTNVPGQLPEFVGSVTRSISFPMVGYKYAELRVSRPE